MIATLNLVNVLAVHDMLNAGLSFGLREIRHFIGYLAPPY
jgi:hypothetical protein